MSTEKRIEHCIRCGALATCVFPVGEKSLYDSTPVFIPACNEAPNCPFRSEKEIKTIQSPDKNSTCS